MILRCVTEKNIPVCVIVVVAGWLRCKQFRSRMASELWWWWCIVVVFVVAGKIVVLVLVLVRWCKILNTEEDIYVSDVSIVVFCCCW